MDAIEALAIDLHEAGRAAVEAGQTVAHTVPGNKTFPFIEWADIPEAAREGRRVQARWLMRNYEMTSKSALSDIAITEG